MAGERMTLKNDRSASLTSRSAGASLTPAERLKLPHQLAPWGPQLSIFPEEIALALGPLVQRVAALVGPFTHHHVEGNVVPDGFAGLAKRGTYDRLIASDWLLADELPEEFMRRSVMGEHLFWKLAYREPTETRSTLVLFDAGPEQLGAPRLLHLAALVVFDARARMAKANVNWGILQSDEDLWPGINFAEVEALLQARGSPSARAEHLREWSRIAEDLALEGEIWVVGGEHLRAILPGTFSSFLVAELPRPGEHKLRAECKPAGKHSRTIELELPEPAACAQLLRDPFAIAITSRRKLLPSFAPRGMVFNPLGNKLWVVTDQGELIVLQVPNSPRATGAKLKHYHTLSRFPIVAIASVGRSTVLVSVNPVSREFSVAVIGRGLSLRLHEGVYAFVHRRAKPVFEYGKLSLCVWHGTADRKPGIYLIDGAGVLFRLFVDQQGERWCEKVHLHALALTPTRAGLCYAAYEPSVGSELRIYLDGGESPLQSWPLPEAPFRAFLGYAPPSDNLVQGLVACGYEKNRWEIYTKRARKEITLPSGWAAHGVVRIASYEETLIVVEDDLQTLSLVGSHGTRRVLKANSAITAVSGCRYLPFIAYATEAGEICVHSLQHGKSVLEFAQKVT
jgi:hypothetical protein